jgi:large subunit ribosomal protein L4
MAVLRTAIGLLDASTRRRSSVLVVAEAEDQLTWKSLRNAPGIRLLAADQLNTYDVLVAEHLVFTQAALDAFVSRTSPGTTITPSASAAPQAGGTPAGGRTAKAGNEPGAGGASGAADAEASAAPKRRPAKAAAPKEDEQ